MNLLIAGHSHSFALGVKALGDVRVEKIADDSINVEGLMGGWKGSRDDEYWAKLADNAKGKDIVLLWAGNQHNLGFLFHEEETFDFYLKGHSTNVDKKLIPFTVVKEHFYRNYKKLHSIIETLKSNDCNSITLVETPPPKGDNESLIPFIKSSDHFLKMAAKAGVDIDNLRLSSSQFRLKLWAVCQHILKEIALQHNIALVNIPAHTIYDDGTLKREYWAEDTTHANNLYGSELLNHIANTLKR